MAENLIDDFRKQIDSIDQNIIENLSRRTEIVLKIGEIKKQDKNAVYHPAREIEIFNRIEEINKNSKFPSPVLIQIYREIISACRALEKRLCIGYFGPQATHTHQAAIHQFGSSCDFIAFRTVADVFKEVELGKVNYGVVPVENSTEGAVNHTLDMFITSSLHIYAEQYMPIHQYLLSVCPDLSSIKRIYSHPQALAQCRLWIENNLPHAELSETSSTSEAVKVCLWDKYSSAVAGRIASELHPEIKILAENIEDNPSNNTRFLVIARKDCAIRSANDKTSLLFAVKDQAGALSRVLNIFSQNNINLNKIESRPSRKKAWEYLFYVDVDGHRSDPHLREVFQAVEKETVFMKILGSYPKARITVEEIS